jgi:hypothetical protein
MESGNFKERTIRAKRGGAMKKLLILVPLLCLPATGESQTVCFQYSGGVISCEREGRYSTQVPLTRELRYYHDGKRA